ncbi:MAG TPA: hypothetical protein VGO00_25595, partial [Kofleriaceae bacterium]|nr:hypothetical protein [Kofleriaceae bacterium]
MRAIPIAIGVLAASTAARADHDGMHMAADEPTQAVTAGLSVLAASFDSEFYGGSYEGVMPSLRWSYGRFGAGTSLAFYRLEANGLDTNGIGDVMGDVDMRIASTPTASLSVMLGFSLPTGDDLHGYGMGHVMAMPMLVGTWTHARVTLTASGGFGRALTDLGSHDHGMWPLVEPMNMSEVTFGGGGDVAIAGGIHAGLRVAGGVPV